MTWNLIANNQFIDINNPNKMSPCSQGSEHWAHIQISHGRESTLSSRFRPNVMFRMPISCLSMDACLVNDVTTNKAWAALSSLLVLVVILHGTGHCSHANLLHHERSASFFQMEGLEELFVNQIRQTTPVVRSFHLLEACKSFWGKNCYNILQSKVSRKINLQSFCRETFLTSFCDWNMPTSCSSESWNQHHGELLSGKRKANLLTTVRQIHFILCTRTVVTFLAPKTECVQGALRLKNSVILENRVHGC